MASPSFKEKRMQNIKSFLTSKRVYALVGGIVMLKFLSEPVSLVCATVIACTYLICETVRKG